jgi:hypothetical protein
VDLLRSGHLSRMAVGTRLQALTLLETSTLHCRAEGSERGRLTENSDMKCCFRGRA